jgi:SagB-type dehydrogenase family enzyme
MSLERALAERRSVRDYQRNEPMSLEHLSQLLWAAQGVTDRRGLRTAPSAGALYPLEIYAIAGKMDGLHSGVYRYKPAGHELVQVLEGERRAELASAALGQSFVRDAPASIVIAAVYERTTRRYRDRGIQYVHMEVGHAAQNVCLQAVALGLGSVVVGAFQDNDVKKILQMPESEEPLAIIPVGRSQ